MHKNILKKWVEALRSKKYKQCCDGFLHVPTTEYTEGSYCVLGVLTDLYQQNQKKNKKPLLRTKIVGIQEDQYMTYSGREDYPPLCVSRWAGLNKGEVEKMANMNDADHSFKYLANYIEKHPENLDD